MKYTIDTVYKTITLEGDCSQDELTELLAQFKDYKLQQPPQAIIYQNPPALHIYTPVPMPYVQPYIPFNPYPIVTCGTMVTTDCGITAIN